MNLDNNQPQDDSKDSNIESPETSISPEIPEENTSEPSPREEEADVSSIKSPSEEAWRLHLKRYHDVVNGTLASKENLKLVCVDKNAKESFSRSWKQESNRFFQLVVNLRRRSLGTTVGGKTVA